jgi:uncharacterized protein (DUF4213/DUF364 family)
MTTVKSELLRLTRAAGAAINLPPVSQIYTPEPNPEQSHTEFGVIMLEDGSAGLYYAWLGISQAGMSRRFSPEEFIGQSPIELAGLYAHADEADCSIGLAAISAVTQCVFRRAGYRLAAAPDSMGALEFKPGDHAGMVGYYPSLVDKLRQRGIRLTVVEKKTKFIETGRLVNVSPEPERLRACNKIIITASTLLNNTVDAILEYAADAERVVMVGPTAGFFPDPIFERGVTALGGTHIVLPDVLIKRLRRDEGMGDAAIKYLIEKDNYPGSVRLLAQLAPG